MDKSLYTRREISPSVMGSSQNMRSSSWDDQEEEGIALKEKVLVV